MINCCGTNFVAVNTLPGCLAAHYSYVSYDGVYNTLIDFICIPVYLLHCVKKCVIFDDNCLNVSRHRPVLLNIVLPFSAERNSLGEPSQYDDVMVNWRKSTKQGILKYNNCLLSDCELSDLKHTENLNSEYIGCAYEVFSERIVRYAANSLPKKKYS